MPAAGRATLTQTMHAAQLPDTATPAGEPLQARDLVRLVRARQIPGSA